MNSKTWISSTSTGDYNWNPSPSGRCQETIAAFPYNLPSIVSIGSNSVKVKEIILPGNGELILMPNADLTLSPPALKEPVGKNCTNKGKIPLLRKRITSFVVNN